MKSSKYLLHWSNWKKKAVPMPISRLIIDVSNGHWVVIYFINTMMAVKARICRRLVGKKGQGRSVRADRRRGFLWSAINLRPVTHNISSSLITALDTSYVLFLAIKPKVIFIYICHFVLWELIINSNTVQNENNS